MRTTTYEAERWQEEILSTDMLSIRVTFIIDLQTLTRTLTRTLESLQD